MAGHRQSRGIGSRPRARAVAPRPPHRISMRRSMDIQDMHLADLHQRARERGMPRYRMMTREQLIEALEEGAGAEEVAEEPREERFEAPDAGERREPEPVRREPEAEPAREPEAEAEQVTGVLDRMPQGYGFP